MSEPSEDPPKIIVDDDWKSQVEKEKREAAQAAASPPAGESDAVAGDQPSPGPAAAAQSSPGDANAAQPSGAEVGGAASSGAEAGGAGSMETPPPATFEMLVTMLFTQAMASLGQLPGPDGQMGPINKGFAKYFIDSVELLGEKTKGNLSDDESKMISEALHAMRMAFVSVKDK